MTFPTVAFPGGNAVMPTFLDHQESGAVASIYTFSGLSFGTPRADRYIAVGVAWLGSPLKTLLSATIGGVAAPILVQSTSTRTTAWIIALVPAGTNGAVVVNFSGNVVSVSVDVYSITGIPSATPSAVAASNASAPTATFSIPANGAVMGIAAGLSASSVSWSGINQDIVVSLSGRVTAASASFAVANPSLTATCTFSPSGTDSGCFLLFSP